MAHPPASIGHSAERASDLPERDQFRRDEETRVREIREQHQDAHAHTVKAPVMNASRHGRKSR
jgi:hypothetical protein